MEYPNKSALPRKMRKLFVVLSLHAETGWWPGGQKPQRWIGPYIDDIADYDRPIHSKAYVALMDLFEAHGARGTFLVFPWIAEHHPDYVQNMVDRGHEVGVHTHNSWQTMDLEEATAAFNDSKVTVTAAAGARRIRSLAIGPAPIMPDQIEQARKALRATDDIFEFTLDHFSPWRADHGLDVYVYRPSAYFPFMNTPKPSARQIHIPEIMATGMTSGRLPIMSEMGGSFLWAEQIHQLMEKAGHLAEIASESESPINLQRVTHTEELCTETSLIRQNFKNFDTVLNYIDDLVETGKAKYMTASELGELVARHI